MVINRVKKALGWLPILPPPLVKANQSFAANFEKILIFQMAALKASFDMGLNQMKAAAEITDIESLQDFYKCQSQIAQTLQQKLLNDAKAVAEMTVRLQSELDNLAEATFEDGLLQAA